MFRSLGLFAYPEIGFFLKRRGITDVAVLEKSYIGSGAAGRNTTIMHSNYKTPEGRASTTPRLIAPRASRRS